MAEQHQGQHCRHAGICRRVGQRAHPYSARHVEHPSALAVAVERHRQPHVGIARNCVGKGFVVLRAVNVDFVEQHVERDRPRHLRLDVVDELPVDGPRPRPASGHCVHLLERSLVDVDDHHAIGNRPTAGVGRQHHVARLLVDQQTNIRRGVIGDDQKRRCHRQPGPALRHEAANGSYYLHNHRSRHPPNSPYASLWRNFSLR
jgi:hypothetical protein